MPPESGITQSYWMDFKRPELTPLLSSTNCEVCVIGAGIAGLTSAYLLAKKGKNVIVVDGGKVICGETQRTTAHISDVLDESFKKMIDLHGVKNISLIKDSLTASIKQIESIIISEKISCDFAWVDGFLWRASGAPADILEKEKAAAETAGHAGIELISSLGSIKGGPPALRYPAQAQFHSIKYLCGMIEALEKMGVKIYADSRVEKVEPKSGPTVILENKCEIKAEHVIVATNSPITDLTMQVKQTAWRTFTIAMKIKKGVVPAGLFWDTEDPYHYVRTHPLDNDDAYELLIAGGEDHRVGEKNDGEERFKKLEAWIREVFSVSGEIVYKWSGQVYEPADGLGFIGLDPELKNNIYLITGDSGMGITNGTIGAMLLRDLILGIENPYEKIYSPNRISLKAAGEFLEESTRSLSKYANNIFTKLTPEEKITPGEGAIIERGSKKIAAYRREDDGQLTTVSPYCTHLQGMLCWNSCEKSWDCPVHGSRFAADGDVIYGPADGNLKAEG